MPECADLSSGVLRRATSETSNAPTLQTRLGVQKVRIPLPEIATNKFNFNELYISIPEIRRNRYFRATAYAAFLANEFADKLQGHTPSKKTELLSAEARVGHTVRPEARDRAHALRVHAISTCPRSDWSRCGRARPPRRKGEPVSSVISARGLRAGGLDPQDRRARPWTPRAVDRGAAASRCCCCCGSSGRGAFGCPRCSPPCR